MEKMNGVLAMTMLEIFGVDNSSSFHADNLKNNFLVLGEGDNFGINGNFSSPDLVLILVE